MLHLCNLYCKGTINKEDVFDGARFLNHFHKLYTQCCNYINRHKNDPIPKNLATIMELFNQPKEPPAAHPVENPEYRQNNVKDDKDDHLFNNPDLKTQDDLMLCFLSMFDPLKPNQYSDNWKEDGAENLRKNFYCIWNRS